MYFKGNETIYSQLAEEIKKKIFSGVYVCGSRLPAIRDLAVEYRVNPNTIVRVYQELEEEGLVYTEGTSGKFVTKDETLAKKKKCEYVQNKARRFAEEACGAGVGKEEALKYAAEAFLRRKD